ncbi:MAG: helix-turn-helix domain-containing protein [Clostridiales bacterium]|nr:helix-turn-helix domain-containing protein [Clostridiales bacterium]
MILITIERGGENLDWQEKMNRVTDYIETTLTGDFDIKTAAALAECSVWELQRVFSFLVHVSLGEYIRLRRLSAAAQEIRVCSLKIIDAAVKYGYDSPTAFSRAFSQVYGIPPSSVRNNKFFLKPYPKISFDFNQEARNHGMNKQSDVKTYSERGYYVRENAPVYLTEDMDKSCKWFRDVLGWYGEVVARDEKGIPEYGCVFDYPGEMIVANLTPFKGIHMFTGKPSGGVVGFILIQGIEAFYNLVKENGWDQITDIRQVPWGAKECRITTIDGCVLRISEAI